MKKGEPISPDDIAEAKVSVIPPEVFDAFNEMIASKFTQGGVTISQDKIIEAIIQKFAEANTEHVSKIVTRSTIFINGWLNIEEVYRAKGWKVRYDKPGYNEDYSAYFEFKA